MRSTNSYKHLKYNGVFGKVFPESSKINEGEWLALVQSQALFDFMGDLGKAESLLAQASPRLKDMPLSVLSRFLLVASQYKQLAGFASAVAGVINQKIEADVSKGFNLALLKPAHLLDLCLGFIHLSSQDERIFVWKTLVVRRLKESLPNFSRPYKLVTIWMLAFFDEAAVENLWPYVEDMVSCPGSTFNFYEKYLLNGLLTRFAPRLAGQRPHVRVGNDANGRAEKGPLKVFDGAFRENLVKHEVANICQDFLGREDFSMLLRKYQEIMAEALNAGVLVNQVVYTEAGQCFYASLHVPARDICVIVVPDFQESKEIKADFARINGFGLEKSGQKVIYVGLTSLLDRRADADEATLESIKEHRKAIVRNLLRDIS